MSSLECCEVKGINFHVTLINTELEHHYHGCSPVELNVKDTSSAERAAVRPTLRADCWSPERWPAPTETGSEETGSASGAASARSQNH